MIILTKKIELPDNATWSQIEDAKIAADRKGWSREMRETIQEKMKQTDLRDKCGSCKYFILKPDLFTTARGDCMCGRVSDRPRTHPKCNFYERKD